MNKKVLLLENIHPEAVDIFRGHGFEVEVRKDSPTPSELEELIKDVSIIGLRSKTQLTPETLDKAENLLAIGAYCVGTDQIDLGYCTQKGLAIFNAPYANTRSVVELTLGNIIMLLRRAADKSQKLHQGIWEKNSIGCFEIRGKKLGIVGYGKIGTQLSVLAETLGMKVYFYDLIDKLPFGNAIKCQSLKELLTTVDIVTVHVDGRLANHHLFGQQEFALMKEKSFFLNLSRGFVVETKALVKALEDGRLAGAALDVYEDEPAGNEMFVSPLQKLSNVILTPHIGGSTEEAQKNIAEFTTEKIIKYCLTGNIEASVNLPSLQIPTEIIGGRFLHIHKNVPGVLANINQVFAKQHINVTAQCLKTSEDIGYALIDVDRFDHRTIEDLKQVPNTIKCRAIN